MSKVIINFYQTEAEVGLQIATMYTDSNRNTSCKFFNELELYTL